MEDRYESRIDRQIREAQERGDFDNLPGTGRPLPDHGELHDEDWWLKDLVRRERLTGLAPATLQVRKDVDELTQKLAGQRDEAAVRRIVAALNQRIERANRSLLDGPPVALAPLDIDEVVTAWHRHRVGGQGTQQLP